MTRKRKHIPLGVKLRIVIPQAICPLCGERLVSYEDTEFDHIKLHALGGSDEPENQQAVHVACHALKTNGPKHMSYGSDKHAIAKTKRIIRKREGKVKPKAKIVNRGFNSEYRRKMDGTIERKE